MRRKRRASDPRFAMNRRRVEQIPATEELLRGLFGRLRERATPHAVDRDLAAGRPAGAAMRIRARRLEGPAHRAALARSLRELVRSADAGRQRIGSRPPIASREIRQAAMSLLALASELEADEPVDARGVALTQLLVTDGCGPLYVSSGTATLEGAVNRARSHLRRPQ
jgi:hypothetical protein